MFLMMLIVGLFLPISLNKLFSSENSSHCVSPCCFLLLIKLFKIILYPKKINEELMYNSLIFTSQHVFEKGGREVGSGRVVGESICANFSARHKSFHVFLWSAECQ